MQTRLSAFLDYLKFEKRYSEHTVRAYGDDLRTFAEFIEQHFAVSRLEEIEPAFVRTWLASLKDQNMSSRSIARKMSSLQSFFKYLLRTGVLVKSPMQQVHKPRISRRLPVFVEQQDLQELFSRIPFPDNWQGLTDRLLLAIFYHTGMRLSELINLRSDHVDFSRRVIKVLGKGNKERIIPISPALCQAIGDYMAAKKASFAEVEADYLLVTGGGKQLYPKYAYLAVRKYLNEVTTITQKSPHILRHSFATHLMNAGADLSSVKELLGHSSLAATQVYTHNTIEKLKEVYKKAHPKA